MTGSPGPQAPAPNRPSTSTPGRTPTLPQRSNGLAGVLVRQLRSPLPMLLCTTVVVSGVRHEQVNAVTILAILTASVGVGVGTFNDYRATRIARRLASQAERRAQTVRDGHSEVIDITALVSGHVVRLFTRRHRPR